MNFASYLKRETPEVLITALEDTNLTAILAHVLAKVPTRIVITVHNNLTQESKHLKSFKRQLVPYFVRWVYPLADLVIAVSHGVAKDLQKLGVSSDKIKVIYNPIITPEFRSRVQASPKHPWFEDSKIPVILGVGRLEQQKEFSTLIEAYSQVRRRIPSRLMILGEGSQHTALIRLCKDLKLEDQDVTFPGFVENPFSYMAKASVCVLSSAWEGFGNVLVESMGAGTPVVSTDCPSGPSEVIENGKYGKLVPVGDAQKMAEEIITTLSQPFSPSKLKKRAEDFSLDKILDEYQKSLCV